MIEGEVADRRAIEAFEEAVSCDGQVLQGVPISVDHCFTQGGGGDSNAGEVNICNDFHVLAVAHKVDPFGCCGNQVGICGCS